MRPRCGSTLAPTQTMARFNLYLLERPRRWTDALRARVRSAATPSSRAAVEAFPRRHRRGPVPLAADDNPAAVTAPGSSATATASRSASSTTAPSGTACATASAPSAGETRTRRRDRRGGARADAAAP
ncbi:MAG: hypothetical protein U0325_30915 [Polyangiales bacterium]